MLRHFISIPEHHPIILGARRSPAIISPAANTRDAVSVYTSVGFRQITSENYTAAAQKLKPDIVVALGDIPYGPKPSLRRADRMGDRTLKWLGDIISAQGGLDKTVKTKVFNIFAPILPISRELQRWYLDHMLDDHLEHISGLAFYDCDNAYDLPDELVNLPRLSFCEPSTPHRLLYEISLGMDVLVIPFINESTDAGIALDFTFPQPNKSKDSAEIKAPLGTDMWSETHALDLKPLREGCECYSCKTHHRAYIQHLLAAKEMLAWVLIQIHNYHVIDQFFASVRSSIANGTFEEDCKTFQLNYEPEMPVQTGQGPRYVRAESTYISYKLIDEQEFGDISTNQKARRRERRTLRPIKPLKIKRKSMRKQIHPSRTATLLISKRLGLPKLKAARLAGTRDYPKYINRFFSLKSIIG